MHSFWGVGCIDIFGGTLFCLPQATKFYHSTRKAEDKPYFPTRLWPQRAVIMALQFCHADGIEILVCPASLRDPCTPWAVQVVQVGQPHPLKLLMVPIRILLGRAIASGDGHMNQIRSIMSFLVLGLEFWKWCCPLFLEAPALSSTKVWLPLSTPRQACLVLNQHRGEQGCEMDRKTQSHKGSQAMPIAQEPLLGFSCMWVNKFPLLFNSSSCLFHSQPGVLTNRLNRLIDSRDTCQGKSQLPRASEYLLNPSSQMLWL